MQEIQIERTKNPKQKPTDQSKLGFGKIFTDHMYIMPYNKEQGWHDPKIVPYQPITLEPSAMVFHYAQEVFEGLKAYRTPDGSIQLFRPDKNAQRMVAEIHRQFNTIKGLREGKPGVKPEYDKCIDIATSGSLRELIPAGLMTIIATIIVGFIGGPSAIGGFLLGNIVSGLLLALFMSNAGGLWDNTKKYIEAGAEGGKGSDSHKAAVIGDTVGDPFKDTAGPSINTQITVVSLVSSLLSSVFVMFSFFG